MNDVLYICPQCLVRYDQPLGVCPDDGQTLRRFSVQREDPLLGTVLDKRWIIEEKIGEGGMGAVYRAQQVSVDRKVAIKTMHTKLAEGEGKNYLDRFLSEANLASKISHPHLVSIHDFGQTPDGVLFIVMEYLDGLSLADVLRSTKLSLHHALTITSQLCQALSAAHQSQVVHRDLKPDNIFLIDMPDNDIFIKVLDFGIAKNLDTEQRMTQTGQVFGTPEYMSPEQCRGSSKIDQRSDLYSLGCILYELLCGHPPFQGESMLKVLFKHVSDDVPELISNDASADDLHDLLTLVSSLLEKKPSYRPGSALNVRRQIEGIQNNPNTPHLTLPAWQSANTMGAFGSQDTMDFPDTQDALSPLKATTPQAFTQEMKATNAFAPKDVATLNTTTPDDPPDATAQNPTQDTSTTLAPITPVQAPRSKWGIPVAVMLACALAVGAYALLVRTPVQTNTPSTANNTSSKATQNPTSIANITPTRKDTTTPPKTPTKRNTDDSKESIKPNTKDATPKVAVITSATKANGKTSGKTTNTKTKSKTSSKTKTKTKTRTGASLRRIARSAKPSKTTLDDVDKTRVMFGKRPRSEIKAQTKKLGNRLRSCVDSAIKRGDQLPVDAKKRVHIYAHYTITPKGRVSKYFLDPNKTSAFPKRVKSCIKSKASGFVFSSEHDISTSTYIKGQHTSFRVTQ